MWSVYTGVILNLAVSVAWFFFFFLFVGSSFLFYPYSCNFVKKKWTFEIFYQLWIFVPQLELEFVVVCSLSCLLFSDLARIVQCSQFPCQCEASETIFQRAFLWAWTRSAWPPVFTLTPREWDISDKLSDFLFLLRVYYVCGLSALMDIIH